MSRFEDFRNALITNKDNEPITEQIYVGDCIINIENGYINNRHGETLPAIECIDAHVEFWENGELNRDDGPAIISSGDNTVEYWKNGAITKTEKYYPHDYKKYFTLGKKAEINFAKCLNANSVPFIHLDQPSKELYSTVFRDKNIKRPDYIIFVDKKPLFIDVKATGCYKLSKTELERLGNFKNEYSMDVVFAVINIDKLETNGFSFLSLENMTGYAEIIKSSVKDCNWEMYPIPATLLGSEIVCGKAGDGELLEIFRKEKEQYLKNKYRFSEILNEYLNGKKYKTEKNKRGSA